MPTRFEISLYMTKDGKIPFADWLEKLRDKRVRCLIKTRLDRVEDGNWGDHKPLREGIFELRIAYGSGYRVYFGQDKGQILILLCGGDKGSQNRDINKAIKYWRDYETRKG